MPIRTLIHKPLTLAGTAPDYQAFNLARLDRTSRGPQGQQGCFDRVPPKVTLNQHQCCREGFLSRSARRKRAGLPAQDTLPQPTTQCGEHRSSTQVPDQDHDAGIAGMSELQAEVGN